MQWTAEGHAGQLPVIVTLTLEGEQGCIGIKAQPMDRTSAKGWVFAAKLIGNFQNEASARQHLRANGFVQNLSQYLRALNAKAKAKVAAGGVGMILTADHKFWSDLSIYTPAQLDAYLTARHEA